ncbi:MAG TPA: cytochrome c [Lysobacter sp.]
MPSASPPPKLPRRRLPQLIACSVAVLGGLLLAAAVLIFVQSERRLRRDYALKPMLGGADAVLRTEGRLLALTRGCADCHGADFGGHVIADEMPFARLVGDNLTRMPRGHEDRSVHERMYRALHHGVDLDSRPLLMMPSKEYSTLSAREIEALAAYFASLAPIERTVPDSRLGPLGRTLLVAGQLEGFLSAEAIDHGTPAIAEPPPRGTLAYGRHTAQLCTGCHRGDFGGGRMSHGGPAAPPAANLTAHATGLAHWNEADFLAAMRSGRRPDGSRINGKFMPWQTFGRADADELRAIWSYLRSLPPVQRDVHAEQP